MAQQRFWKAETRANFSGYEELQKDIREGLVDTTDRPNNPYSVAMRRMGEIYREFLKRQFDRNKAGGGRWKAISKETKKWRRLRHGITHSLILYVTRTLYRTTDKKYSRAKGHYEKRTKYGITVGVAGGIPHPDFRGTLWSLVQIHTFGKGHNPRRPIYVKADQETLKKMHNSMLNAHRKAVAKANKKVKTKPMS